MSTPWHTPRTARPSGSRSRRSSRLRSCWRRWRPRSRRGGGWRRWRRGGQTWFFRPSSALALGGARGLKGSTDDRVRDPTDDHQTNDDARGGGRGDDPTRLPLLRRPRARDPLDLHQLHARSDARHRRRVARAGRDGDWWFLNGEKIFVTAGNKSLIDTPGFVVVWATIDPAAGRAGMRPFVVGAGTPGGPGTKLEPKPGIRP